MKNFLIESFGWVGMVLILTSYALLATGIIEDNLWYHGMLLVGSLGLAIVSYVKKAWQPMALNAIFVVLAIIAIFRFFL